MVTTPAKVIDALSSSEIPVFFKNLWEPLLLVVRDLVSKAGGVSKLGSLADGLLSSTLNSISLFLQLFHANESVS